MERLQRNGVRIVRDNGFKVSGEEIIAACVPIFEYETPRRLQDHLALHGINMTAKEVFDQID